MTDPNPVTGKEALFFDDLRVGQRFTSGKHTIDAEQIAAFARQFDPQPFHLDGEAAKEAFFGELVASGWHTAGVTMRGMVQSRVTLCQAKCHLVFGASSYSIIICGEIGSQLCSTKCYLCALEP